ncbi:MAG: hypothetical protein COB22_08135 [Cycloclasticus sp.]|nr:MAG: hypothetical protein COB22_08135 [Cycloclasticus sp.]
MPEHSIPASFNEHSIRNAKWLGKDFRLSIGECLYLQVRKSSKTWLVRRRIDGKVSVTTIEQHQKRSINY